MAVVTFVEVQASIRRHGLRCLVATIRARNNGFGNHSHHLQSFRVSSFVAGNMTTLQLQHYNIYPFVGRDTFQSYMQANNKAAIIPSILPAMLLLVVTIGLLFFRPGFMSMREAVGSLLLNIVALVSTFVWQRKMQAEMAVLGYDEVKINQLVSTNWIRTVAFLLQAVMAVSIIIHAVRS